MPNRERRQRKLNEIYDKTRFVLLYYDEVAQLGRKVSEMVAKHRAQTKPASYSNLRTYMLDNAVYFYDAE